MENHKVFSISLSDEQLDSIDEVPGTGHNCGVLEGHFPYLGKCYVRSSSIEGVAYKKACSYCSIWTSLPDSVNLAVANIFECSLYGYGKRIKE